MALSLKKQIERFLNGRIKTAMNEVAEIIPKEIRKRTQLGKDLSNNKLKKLSKSYKLYRAGKISFFSIGSGANRKVIPIKNPKNKPELDSNTTPNRSNLTATGQLLNSIKCTVKGLAFEVTLDDKRTRELSGKAPTKTNNEIKDYQEQQGRSFFGILDYERLFIMRQLLKRLKKK